MYSVPFLVWQSESWKRSNPIDISFDMTHRLYSLSDFFHSWMDLAGISFSGFEPGKSIINRRFAYAPVLIGNPAKPETLVDVRQKFFPARPARAVVATPASTRPGSGPAVLQPATPAYKPGYGPHFEPGAGTVPARVQQMLHP